MVINQMQTTYRKDYLWPYVRTFGYKSSDIENPCMQHEFDHEYQNSPESQQRKLYGPDVVQEQSWSRLGPMGPLLDPKIYPARVGASPESSVSRYEQPNVFLQKLKEKYPYIYECLRSAPPDDFISRINRDRLRSTYQVDFCHMQEYPLAPYDELIRASGVRGLAPNSESIKLPGDVCRPNQKLIAFRPAVISNRVGGGTGGNIGGGGGKTSGTKSNCIGTCFGPLATITPGATEYQDNVSRLARLMVSEKLLG